MDITCCACGKDLPDKVDEAIRNAEWSKLEDAPILGIVCTECEENINAPST